MLLMMEEERVAAMLRSWRKPGTAGPGPGSRLPASSGRPTTWTAIRHAGGLREIPPGQLPHDGELLHRAAADCGCISGDVLPPAGTHGGSRASTGWRAFRPQSDATLAEARQAMGPTPMLWGGIPQDYVMPMVDRALLRRSIAEARAFARGDGRTIVGVADHVPVDAEWDRIREIADALNS